MLKLSRYILFDILRNRIVIGYALFLFILSFSMFRMEEDGSRALLSIMNIILIVLPLVSLVFTTIHYYNSYEFIELMLSQPMSRAKILLGEYASVCISLVGAFWAGTGIPLLLFAPGPIGLSMLFTGTALTVIFSSIAFFASVHSKDKARGIGFALLLWFYFALIYDGLILLILFAFSDYPMEKFTLLLSALNPVDLGRIFIILKMDISALMGYTGAVYKDFFGAGTGILFSCGVMFIWAIVPLWLAVRKFRKKDM